VLAPAGWLADCRFMNRHLKGKCIRAKIYISEIAVHMDCIELFELDFLFFKMNTTLSLKPKKSQSESLRRKDQKYLLIFFQEDYCSMSSPT
jgi:hypothetical protein